MEAKACREGEGSTLIEEQRHLTQRLKEQVWRCNQNVITAVHRAGTPSKLVLVMSAFSLSCARIEAGVKAHSE
eukprot:3946924-Amphidinium_carterae.1